MPKKKVNRKFIAEKAKVSTATVSYVLNNIPNSRIGENTKKRVIATAKKYNYYPNILARSLAMNKTFNIGFINTLPLVSFLSDSFQNSIFAGIESEIEKNGYSLLFSLLKNPDEINFSVQKMVCGNIVDGIVLYGKVEPHFVKTLQDNNVKFVLIDFYLDDLKTMSVLPDNINGAYEATKYLIGKNIKKIYCLNGDTKHPSYKERPMGYKKAMKEAHLKPYILKTNPFIEETYIFINKLIQKKDLPEAFITTGDNMAIATVRCLTDNGINIPQKIKVMGFDDNPHVDREQIKLSTVRVPKMEMGREAVKRLLAMIKDTSIKPEITRLPTSLVIRETA